MNATVPLIVSVVGLVVGAFVSVFGVVRTARLAGRSPGPEPSRSVPESPQALITIAPEQLQGSHSEVVVYTSSGKAEHYALSEPPAAVATRIEAAAQAALHGAPTRIETAEAPHVALAD